MLKCSCKFLNQGLWGWLLQRLTAVFLALYFVPILVVWLLNPAMDYYAWSGWLTANYMLVFLFLTLGALLIHAYLGLWIVCTDYIGNKILRNLILAGIALYLLGCFGLAFIAIIF